MGIGALIEVVPAVFLDRDGVINRACLRNDRPFPPATPAEFEILPGSAAWMQRLTAAGYVLIVATNQPDVARGTQTRAVVESMNSLVLSRLPVLDILVCYHDDSDGCDCRKPRPGLILRGAKTHAVDLSRSWMAGDRWKDVSAGRAAGLRTVFVDYHYAESFQGPAPDFMVEAPAQIADIILNRKNQ